MYGIGRRLEIMEERWPLEKDLMAYFAWLQKRLDRGEKERNTSISQSDLIHMISTIDYTNEDQRDTLLSVIDKRAVPRCPIGTDMNGVRYRLVPEAYGLQPDRESPPVNCKILDSSVLGVNTNVQPLQPPQPPQTCDPNEPDPRHRLGLPEVSSDLNEFGDWKSGGFVFHQLGALELWFDLGESSKDSNFANKGSWQPTSFFVVVRFSCSGDPEGIYIIYNFYPEDDLDGNRDRKIDGYDWGYLSDWELKAGIQFSMARIADNIGELGYEHKLNFTEVCDYPVEIVPALQTQLGTIVRATVARD